MGRRRRLAFRSQTCGGYCGAAAWPGSVAPFDLALRVGAYTDFQTFTTDSWRITGRALAVVQLTPTFTLSGGVEYLDRLDVKLLPAGPEFM